MASLKFKKIPFPQSGASPSGLLAAGLSFLVQWEAGLPLPMLGHGSTVPSTLTPGFLALGRDVRVKLCDRCEDTMNTVYPWLKWSCGVTEFPSMG